MLWCPALVVWVGFGVVEILYEDEWLLAADKPAGVLVHGDGTGAPTLTDGVREQLAARGEAAAAAQLQAVQRLDVDTTGIVLFSKSKKIQPMLDALVAAHGAVGKAGMANAGNAHASTVSGVTKRYLAIVRGEAPWETQLFTQPLARDRHDARRMRIDRQGKAAKTGARRLAVTGSRGKRLTLLELELGTGRKHQIRVHLASAGLPIMGDTLYGVPSDRRGKLPLMLHAAELSFVHPVTSEPMVIRSPYPQRFSEMFANPWTGSLLP